MSTRVIPLGRHHQHETVVSEEDYAYLTQWRWTFKRSSWKYGAKIYARRCARIAGRKTTIYMHIVILTELMGLPQPTDTHEGDHIDVDSLYNVRANLRWATKSEQNFNQRPRLTGAQRVAYEVACACDEVPF